MHRNCVEIEKNRLTISCYYCTFCLFTCFIGHCVPKSFDLYGNDCTVLSLFLSNERGFSVAHSISSDSLLLTYVHIKEYNRNIWAVYIFTLTTGTYKQAVSCSMYVVYIREHIIYIVYSIVLCIYIYINILCYARASGVELSSCGPYR